MNRLLIISLLLIFNVISAAAQDQSAMELYYAGQAAYALFENEAALEFFTQAININPEFAEAYAHRGEMYRLFIEYDLAQQDFDKAESLEPDNPVVLGHLARWYSHNTDNETALEYANRAIELLPNDPSLYYRRARVYWNMYDYERAISDFEVVIASNDATAGMRSNYSALLYEVGLYEEALDVASEVISDYPEFARPYLIMGSVYLQLGRFDEAMEAYLQIEIVNSDNVRGIVERANMLWTYGDRESAITEYERALAFESDQDLVYVNWGVKHDLDGEDQRARDLYLQAIEVNPKNSDGYYNLGTLDHEIDVQQAMENYRSAIMYNPRYYQAYLNLGNLLRDQQEWDEALEMYNLATESYSLFWFAYFQKGILLESIGFYELAIIEYDNALAINPYYAPAHYAKGYSYMSISEYDLAISSFEAAIELAPDLAVAYYYLGYVYDVLGDAEQAELNYGTARELGYP